MVAVAGRFAITATDGSRRKFKAGDVLVLEDTRGKGHSSEILGESDTVVVVIHLE